MVQKFVDRHDMKSVTLHGEAGSVDDTTIAEDMEEIRKAYEDYAAEGVMDQHGRDRCLLRPAAQQELPVDERERKTVRGTKDTKAKDRLTAVTCANTIGSFKLPVAIIGNTSTSRSSVSKKIPCFYLNQCNS